MHADSLETIWTATRPEEPSAEAFDTLWAVVTARASEPEILPMSGYSGWRRWALGGAIVAQAAGLLIAAAIALAPPKTVEVAKVPPPTPPPTLHHYRVDAGFTTFVRLDARGAVQAVEARPQATDDSETDVVAAESDILSFMESYE